MFVWLRRFSQYMEFFPFLKFLYALISYCISSLAHCQRGYKPRLLPVTAALHVFRHKPTSEVTTTKQLFNECNYQQTGC